MPPSFILIPSRESMGWNYERWFFREKISSLAVLQIKDLPQRYLRSWPLDLRGALCFSFLIFSNTLSSSKVDNESSSIAMSTIFLKNFLLLNLQILENLKQKFSIFRTTLRPFTHYMWVFRFSHFHIIFLCLPW